MTDLERQARNYLTPPIGAFWQWTDDGTVIVLRNGATVAFDAELLAVLRWLAPQGLPPLSSVVLLLAATRTAWHANSQLMATMEPLWLHGSEMIVERASRLFAGLDRVTLLDAEVRAPLAAKVAIADLVLEDVPRKTDPRLARAVVELLENGVGDDVPIGRLDDDDLYATAEVFDLPQLLSMVPGLERVTAERLELRMRTGLDDLVEPAELDLPLAEQVRALLVKLEQDDELGGLAGLARNLMAAVTLPRPVSDPDELPLGGVSDITNRGPLDRLLLSELAHDDLTLAVRVAVGEALYLRRESSPRTPPRQRSLLLDAGLRTWGLPRTFVTAVALAFAATSDRAADFVIRRARGKDIQPVDLGTRAGLVEHLGALATELHPGQALEAFCRELPPGSAEPLIVTTAEALDDPQFAAALRRQPLAPLFLAGVSRAGDFFLYHETGRGRKLLRQAQLDLEQLVKLPRRRTAHRAAAKDLPAIFSVEPFPLLLPQRIDPLRSWEVEGHGTLAITKDRRLLQYTRRDRGARQLSDALPKGGLHWFTTGVENMNAYAVVGSLQTARLRLLEILLDRASCNVLSLELPQPLQPVLAVCSHHGALLVVCARTVEVLEMATGRHLQSFVLPEKVRWHRGRLFRGAGEACLALSFDGASAVLESALGAHAERCPKLLTVFERTGIEGPVGVTTRGDLFSTATGNLRKVDHGLIGPLQVLAVSADGRRVVLGHEERPPFAGRKRVVVDVDTLAVATTTADPRRATEPARVNVGFLPTLRNRFLEIFVSRSGELTLRSRRQHLAIAWESAGPRICLKPRNDVGALGDTRRGFEPLENSGRGYRLHVARFRDGSRAVLDSRGLLHLASGDKTVPEVTLVLEDFQLSGWCSDGRMWGRAYFLGDVRAADTCEIFASTIKAFTERLA